MGQTDTGRPAGTPLTLVPIDQECWQHFFDSSTQLCQNVNQLLMTEHDLALVDVLLLEYLTKSDRGSARMGDLARSLTLIPSRATARIRRLESRSLVTRATDPHDRRSVQATITPAGRIRLHNAMHTYARAVRTLYLSQLSRNQMTSVGDCCRRVSAALPPAPFGFD